MSHYTSEQAQADRKAAWEKLWAFHNLTVIQWGELADTLDAIIEELTGMGHPSFTGE